VLTKADVLRVKVSQANAKQQEIQAHAQAEVARANLIGAIGVSLDDESVQFAEPATLLAEAKAPLPDAKTAQRTAAAQRPELQQRKSSAESAHHTAKARGFALLPDFDFEGGYLHFDGQTFNAKNSGYVGVKAQWAVWEWGASFYAHKAATAEADAADLAEKDMARQIGVTIESAEEAYRVTKAGLQAGTATTTDLLDAQSALTQARLNLTRAQYEDALTRVTLKRGLGTH